MESLSLQLTYQWVPFTCRRRQLTFEQLRSTRLNRAECSHWDAAIYKWEGLLNRNEHTGKVGVLIGETGDLRQRIKQYISGTQEGGNRYWREHFLTNGDVYLYVLGFAQEQVAVPSGESITFKVSDLASNNVRLVLEQLLVLNEVAKQDEKRWIVNRKL